MSPIFLLARRELGGYLRTMTGWIIAASLLLIDGLLFNAFALEGARRSTEVLTRFFYFASGPTMVAAIFLAMRLLAEERQLGTLALLYASPVRDRDIVLGKFLGALAFLSGLTLATVYMPLLILVHGHISVGHLLAGYLGLLLLGAASLGLGTLGSSLARNQIIAAIIGAALLVSLLVAWLLAPVTEPPFSALFAAIALHNAHFPAVPVGPGAPARRGLLPARHLGGALRHHPGARGPAVAMNARSALLTAATVLGLLAVFLGERVVGAGSAGSSSTCWARSPSPPPRSSAGTARRSPPPRHGPGSSGSSRCSPPSRVLALLAWFAQSDVVLTAGGPDLPRSVAPAGHRARSSPPRCSPRRRLCRCSLGELAYAAMAHAPEVEVGRVQDAVGTGVALVAVLTTALALGWVADVRGRVRGLELLPPGRPSESTRGLVRGFTEPVTLTLFYPPGSETGAAVRDYAESLADGEPAPPRRAPGRGGGPRPGPRAGGERERRHRGELAASVTRRTSLAPRSTPRGVSSASWTPRCRSGCTRSPAPRRSSTSPPDTASGRR